MAHQTSRRPRTTRKWPETPKVRQRRIWRLWRGVAGIGSRRRVPPESHQGRTEAGSAAGNCSESSDSSASAGARWGEQERVGHSLGESTSALQQRLRPACADLLGAGGTPRPAISALSGPTASLRSAVVFPRVRPLLLLASPLGWLHLTEFAPAQPSLVGSRVGYGQGAAFHQFTPHCLDPGNKLPLCRSVHPLQTPNS